MAARPTPDMARRSRDFDDFDPLCDHLLVLDHSRGEGASSVVGTYRQIRRSAAERHGGFYTTAEYDIAQLEALPGEILELGRSCVDAGYRTRPTMQLMWRGIAEYVFRHRILVMFGCASLPGTDPAALALPLSYLYHYHLAPEALRARKPVCRLRMLPRDHRAHAGTGRPAAAGEGLSAARRPSATALSSTSSSTRPTSASS
jgi:putative hemolysin